MSTQEGYIGPKKYQVVTERPEWFERALAVPYTEDFVTVDGTKVHYLAWGDQDAQPLVLVHGNGAHAHWFHFIGGLLHAKYRVVAITLSGMGDSGWRERYTRDTMAQDVAGVVEALGLDNIYLMGHSFGGLISLVAARELGDRCAALVLADYFPRLPEDAVEWFADKEPGRPTRVYQTRELALARFRLMPQQFCPNQYLLDFIADKSIREVEGGWTWKFDHGLYDHMRVGSDSAEILHNLTCPTALIHGEFTQEENPNLVQQMPKVFKPGSPIVSLPESQHHLMLDQPLPFITELEALFEKLIS